MEARQGSGTRVRCVNERTLESGYESRGILHARAQSLRDDCQYQEGRSREHIGVSVERRTITRRQATSERDATTPEAERGEGGDDLVTATQNTQRA